MTLAIIITAIISLIFLPFIISGLSGAVFFPTGSKKLKKAIKLAQIKKSDKVVDLGSGDGRFLFEVSRFCKNATGFEIQPILVVLSKLKTRRKGYSNVYIRFRDFWGVDLEKYNVIFVFLVPHRMKKLEDKILKEVKKGTRVISYAMEFPNLEYKKKTQDGLYLYEV